MTIHQLSIFLENTTGTLVQVLQLLKKANIQLISTTIADTAEYGILRIVCAEPMRACEELSKAGISFAYIYTFLLRGKGILIFRTNDPELAKQTIADNQLPYLTEADFSEWE